MKHQVYPRYPSINHSLVALPTSPQICWLNVPLCPTCLNQRNLNRSTATGQHPIITIITHIIDLNHIRHIRWVVAKSCTTNFGWVLFTQNHGMLGVPLHQPFSIGISHDKPTSYWDSPMTHDHGKLHISSAHALSLFTRISSTLH